MGAEKLSKEAKEAVEVGIIYLEDSLLLPSIQYLLRSCNNAASKGWLLSAQTGLRALSLFVKYHLMIHRPLD